MISKYFQDFFILKQIGKGGMGNVCLAWQKSLQRKVAIKMIPPNSSGTDIRRFLREAKIASSIDHPNIVKVYGVGREENFYYLIMEYIEGQNLELQIVRNRIDESVAWKVALQICQALRRVMREGIIHRDIKPANILLTRDLAKLTDFGLSKQKKLKSKRITRNGLVVGSPHYISPEQASGNVVDFRSDIYSLGATIYHCLTAQKIFNDTSEFVLMCKHMSEHIKHPQGYVPSLKNTTVHVLGKMLQKKSDDRYRSYDNLIADIRCILSDERPQFTDESYTNVFYPKIKQITTESLYPSVGNNNGKKVQKHAIAISQILEKANLEELKIQLRELKKMKGILGIILLGYSGKQIHAEMPASFDSESFGPAIVDLLQSAYKTTKRAKIGNYNLLHVETDTYSIILTILDKFPFPFYLVSVCDNSAIGILKIKLKRLAENFSNTSSKNHDANKAQKARDSFS